MPSTVFRIRTTRQAMAVLTETAASCMHYRLVRASLPILIDVIHQIPPEVGASERLTLLKTGGSEADVRCAHFAHAVVQIVMFF